MVKTTLEDGLNLIKNNCKSRRLFIKTLLSLSSVVIIGCDNNSDTKNSNISSEDKNLSNPSSSNPLLVNVSNAYITIDNTSITIDSNDIFIS